MIMILFPEKLRKSNNSYRIIKGLFMYETIIFFHEDGNFSTFQLFNFSTFQLFNFSTFQPLFVLRSWQCSECLCGVEDVGVIGVFADFSVAQDDVPRGVLRDFRVVGDEDDGASFGM